MANENVHESSEDEALGDIEQQMFGDEPADGAEDTPPADTDDQPEPQQPTTEQQPEPQAEDDLKPGGRGERRIQALSEKNKSLNEQYLEAQQQAASASSENEQLKERLAQLESVVQSGGNPQQAPPQQPGDPDFTQMAPGDVVAYLRQQITNDLAQQLPAAGPTADQIRQELRAEQQLDGVLEEYGGVLTPEHRHQGIQAMVHQGASAEQVFFWARPDLVKGRLAMAEQAEHSRAIQGPSGSQRSAPGRRAPAKPQRATEQSEDDSLESILDGF